MTVDLMSAFVRGISARIARQLQANCRCGGSSYAKSILSRTIQSCIGEGFLTSSCEDCRVEDANHRCSGSPRELAFRSRGQLDNAITYSPPAKAWCNVNLL